MEGKPGFVLLGASLMHWHAVESICWNLYPLLQNKCQYPWCENFDILQSVQQHLGETGFLWYRDRRYRYSELMWRSLWSSKLISPQLCSGNEIIVRHSGSEHPNQSTMCSLLLFQKTPRIPWLTPKLVCIPMPWKFCIQREGVPFVPSPLSF